MQSKTQNAPSLPKVYQELVRIIVLDHISFCCMLKFSFRPNVNWVWDLKPKVTSMLQYPIYIVSLKIKTNTHNGAHLSTEYIHILIGMNESTIPSEYFVFLIVNGIFIFHGL